MLTAARLRPAGLTSLLGLPQPMVHGHQRTVHRKGRDLERPDSGGVGGRGHRLPVRKGLERMGHERRKTACHLGAWPWPSREQRGKRRLWRDGQRSSTRTRLPLEGGRRVEGESSLDNHRSLPALNPMRRAGLGEQLGRARLWWEASESAPAQLRSSPSGRVLLWQSARGAEERSGWGG